MSTRYSGLKEWASAFLGEALETGAAFDAAFGAGFAIGARACFATGFAMGFAAGFEIGLAAGFTSAFFGVGFFSGALAEDFETAVLLGALLLFFLESAI